MEHLEQIVSSVADITNGLMAVPNLVSLLMLQSVIVAETRHYLGNGNLDREERGA